jgi:hypothetical protein
VGAIEKVHAGGGVGAAACDTVNVLPAAVIVPLRAAPEFAATVNDTVPFPVPDAPLETVIHAAFDAALHAQLVADAVIAIDPDPPVSPTDVSLGAIEKLHGAGPAACETANVCPAIVSIPVRAAPLFAATA